MRLIRLHLKNFLSHRETEVVFPETGITLISGENAMGKSSLFDALRFALFGRSFRNARELVTKGEKSLWVEAEFTHRGHKYKVEKKYAATGKELKPTSAKLWKDDSPAAVGNVSNLAPFIIRELGINHEMFRYSVMAVQGEIMGVLGLSPSERSVVFERMFGYHHLRLVAEAAASLASEQEEKLHVIIGTTGRASQEELERDMREGEKALAEKEVLLSVILKEKETLRADEDRLAREGRDLEAEERELNEQEKERAALERETKVMGEEIERIQAHIQENEQKVKEIPVLMESLKVFEGKMEELSTLRAELGILSETEKKAERAEEINRRLEETRGYEKTLKELLPSHERFRSLREKEESIRAEMGQIKERMGQVKELRNALARKQKEKDDLERRLVAMQDVRESKEELLALIEDKESEARKTEAERGEVAGRIKKLEGDIAAIEKLGDTCPLCKQSLTPEHRADVLGQLQGELAEGKMLAGEIAGRSEAIAEELGRLKKLYKAAEERERLGEQISRCVAEMSEARKRLDETARDAEKHEALIKKLNEVRAEISALEPAERKFAAAEEFISRNPRERLESALAEAREEIEKLAGKRRFPNLNPDELRARIDELSPAEREYGKLETEIKNLEKLAQEVASQAELLEKKRAGLAERRSRLESLAGLETKKARLEERKKIHSEARERLQASKQSLSERGINIERDIQAMKKELSDMSGSLELIRKAGRKLELLSEVRTRLLSPQGIDREFAAAMRRLEDNLNACFQDFSFSGLQSVHLDDDLVPVKVDEMGRQMERLSGGEQVAMGIAMRFAIARTLLHGESESLFLDEPTHNLDSDRISSLQELLQEFKMHPTTPQIVIITHDEDMKVIADTVIEVVKEEGVSRIVSGETQW